MGRHSPHRFKLMRIFRNRREFSLYIPDRSVRHKSTRPTSPHNEPPAQDAIPQINPQPQITQVGPTIPIPQPDSQIVFLGSQTLDQESGMFDTFFPYDQEGSVPAEFFQHF